MPSDRSDWDAYAPFYDWENARTLGRRDLAFWRTLARKEQTSVLELGCGTGRLIVPLARAGVDITGIDRSDAMLARARTRAGQLPARQRPALLRGDIRMLPFRDRSFGLVMAPYGMLQSLLSDRHLAATLRECARVLERGGRFGIDLVPDLAEWPTYRSKVRLRGKSRNGAAVTLIETVRQNRRTGVTTFHERFLERRNGGRARERRFTLSFRTVPMAAMLRRVERCGFRIDAVLGDYGGRAWDKRADVWLILATRA